jgi:hypothetical protein
MTYLEGEDVILPTSISQNAVTVPAPARQARKHGFLKGRISEYLY